MHYLDMKLKKLVPIILEEQYLYEGLIRTYPIGTTIGMVDRWIDDMSGYQIKDENIIYIDIININYEKLNHLVKFMDSMGWFPAAYNIGMPSKEHYKKYNEDELRKIIKSNNIVFVRIYFHAKYDLEIGRYDLPDSMYHVTPFNKLDKILKIGLAPKSKDKIATLPNRIYLLKNKEDISKLLINKKFVNDSIEFAVLKINIKLIKERTGIRFFEDPEFADRAVYTYENIRPDYIEFVDKISINTNK